MKDDTQKDRRMARIVLSGSVAMLPLIAGAALLAGNDLAVAALMSALFSAIGVLHLWRPSVFPRAILGIGLTGQAISLTAALTGHPWQVDAHMTFFALLATLIALMDVPTIVAATLVIAVHHLALTFALPALVYPSLSLGLNIKRTIFHAVVVLVESGALILTIRRLRALDAENSLHMDAAEAASVMYDMNAVPMLRMSACVRFCFAFCRASIKFGIRMAAMMPMIATTIRSSISVKPRWRFRSFEIIPPPCASGKTFLRSIPQGVRRRH